MKLRNLYLLSLLMAALLAIAGGLQAQQESAAAAEGAKPLVHNKTLMEQIKEGGWVMFPIFAVSILMVYPIADRVLRTGAKKALAAEQVESVRSFFRQGDYVGAYNFCKANPSPFTNVCRVAISLLGEGKVVVEDGIVAEVAKENSRMQTYISY